MAAVDAQWGARLGAMAARVEFVLTEAALAELAGATVLGRGQEYVDKVQGLRVSPTSVEGSVQGARVYVTRLDWSGDELYAECSCPHAAEGAFCKHLVAIGLRALDDTVEPATPHGAGGIRSYLGSLDVGQLADLVLEMAAYSDRAIRALQVRAAAASGDTAEMSEQLTRAVTSALSPRGFIDYRRSFDVAADIQSVLDEIQGHLAAGAADAVRPALLKALTRLVAITQRADDSSGVLGDACQRAADLYARSCREGKPEGVKLAKWLVKFRGDSPGWPDVELADFAPAFDAKALTAYRRGVAALDAARPRAEDPARRWDRFEIDRMLLELADHDADVDRAVEILSWGEHPEYVGIVGRLRDAGRVGEAMRWVDRAVSEGRVAVPGGPGLPSRIGPGLPSRSGVGPGRRRGSYWLDPEEVADWYVEDGRGEEALVLMRALFARGCTVPAYDALLRTAERVGDRATERAAALAVARAAAERHRSSMAGAQLVAIALFEGDLDAAWAAAREFGAGSAWQQLAAASAMSRPGEAADLYRPALAEALNRADKRSYEQVAALLTAMRPLLAAAGREEEFVADVREIREVFKRRPTMIATMDRAGLPA